MNKILVGFMFLFCSGLCWGQAPSQHSTKVPSRKIRKQKSLTTAQLYKVGPFLGDQTIGSLPQVKSPWVP